MGHPRKKDDRQLTKTNLFALFLILFARLAYLRKMYVICKKENGESQTEETTGGTEDLESTWG